MADRRVVCVLGTPRRGKNTATLAEKVLEGVRSVGGEPELFFIDDMEIYPCQGCESCKDTQICIQQDDMHKLYEAINRSQGLVLGTPIYFDHVSAQTKLFLDRLYSYLGPNLENRFPKDMACVLVVTWGDANPHLYDQVIEWIKGRLSFYFGIRITDVITAANFENYSAQNRENKLKEAHAAGVRLIETIRNTPSE